MDVTRRHALATGVSLAAATLIPGSRPGFASAESKPPMTVYKDASCGCCGGWVEHMIKAGYRVTAIDVNDLAAVKTRYGVLNQLASCHTAEIAGFVVEGHVPAAAVDQLLASRPLLRGLAVPGMPVGSPGMEVPGQSPERYDVIGFGGDANKVFMSFRGITPV
jgi:hypothetical protein